MLATENLREADRLMTVCNACRYCEGLCAVFPAMEMRRTFAASDLNYLANLCHQCGACYPDCQYSPPHEFNVNVPATLAKLRNDSYADYAWPRALAGAFERNGLAIALTCAASVMAFIVGFVAFADPAALWSRNAGDFYKVMPHRAMVVLFGAAALYAIVAFVFSLRAFWRDINAGAPARGFAAFWQAIADTFTLRYLGGGGGGCTSEDEQPSNARRLYHHATFYGFLLCFAATSVATIYHYAFGWHAPYALIQSAGAARHSRRPRSACRPGRAVPAGARARPQAHRSGPRRHGHGLHRHAVPDQPHRISADDPARHAPPWACCSRVHLGVVLALFLSLPYGKFVHGLYRFLALVKYAGERRERDVC